MDRYASLADSQTKLSVTRSLDTYRDTVNTGYGDRGKQKYCVPSMGSIGWILRSTWACLANGHRLVLWLGLRLFKGLFIIFLVCIIIVVVLLPVLHRFLLILFCLLFIIENCSHFSFWYRLIYIYIIYTCSRI